MRLRESLRQGMRTWSPREYRGLVALPLREVLRLFWSWFGLVVVVMLVVGLPQLFLLEDKLEASFSSFETFTVSFNVSMSSPATVTYSPLVVVDLDREELTRERVLLNEEGVHVRRPFWRGVRTLPWEGLSEVPQNADRYKGWILLLVVLLVPSFLLALCLAFLVEAAVLGVVAVLLVLAVTRLLRFRIGARQAVKVALLSLVPFMVVQLVPFFWVRWFVVPAALYALLVLAAAWVVGESRLDRRAG
ncbi:hypothetical protein JXA12_01190 [Candidatus Woesearchaeota archaeon]|nr:hypothetical protein [Candidatus Woesearchaeota archaeon]